VVKVSVRRSAAKLKRRDTIPKRTEMGLRLERIINLLVKSKGNDALSSTQMSKVKELEAMSRVDMLLCLQASRLCG